jgi:hypothetical protein
VRESQRVLPHAKRERRLDSADYRKKAAHALRLAKGIGPGDVADQLRALATIYDERAAALELQSVQQQQQPQSDTRDE